MDNEFQNINIENFNINIQNSIQSSGLPVGTVFYLLKNKLNEVEKLYNQQLQLEVSKYKEKQNDDSADGQSAECG